MRVVVAELIICPYAVYRVEIQVCDYPEKGVNNSTKRSALSLLFFIMKTMQKQYK